MTASSTTSCRTRPGDGGVLLADALSVNALASGATGIALAVGGAFLDDAIGASSVVLILVGVGLVLFADGILAALARPTMVRRAARWVIAADMAWVAGAVTVIAGDMLTPLGDGVLATVTTAVAGFAIAQALGLSRAGRHERLGVRHVALVARREVTAAPTQAWALVADAAGYAHFAPGIASTVTDGEVRAGMRRTCIDDGGRTWSESCTLVEPGRRYAMDVDTATSPLRHRLLFDHFGMTWEITPTDGGSRLELTFRGGIKLGLLGRLAVVAMTRSQPQQRIVNAYARRLSKAMVATT